MGDWRQYLPGYEEEKGKRRERGWREGLWGREEELWGMDLRSVDLGLVGDKVERAVREAFTKYLLLDAKSRKCVLVLPSLIPRELLGKVVGRLFERFAVPSVQLCSSPVLCAAAAGVRCAIVVDVGWRESVVTGVAEFREVGEMRTTRGMRRVQVEMAWLLQRWDRGGMGDVQEEEGGEGAKIFVGLDQVEEVTMRMAWCRSQAAVARAASVSEDLSSWSRPHLVSIAEDEPPEEETATDEDNPLISLPSPSSPRESIQIPFSQLAEPVETALLAKSTQKYDLDDHEQPLHILIYKSLVSLPPDLRALCMSRIIITGGGSNIPGLKPRLVDEVVTLAEERGWDPVLGKAADERRRRLKQISNNRQAQPANPGVAEKKLTTTTEDQPLKNTLPAHLAPQVHDPIEEKLLRDQNRGSKPSISGVVRGIETLGAWAGASLLCSLRIKGVVEIERDAFLQYGLAGARRDAEASAAPQNRFPRAGVGEKTGWTLGAWA